MGRVFYGWWVVGGAFVLLFLSIGTQSYAYPVFFDAILRDMGWSRAQTSIAFAIGMLVIGIASLAVGVLVRKTGVRLILISGSIVAGIGFTLVFIISTLWEFYIFYGIIFCLGIGCMSEVPNLTAVESWFERKQSTALGMATMGIGAGGAVMAPFAGWLIAIYGWRVSGLIIGALVMVIGVLVSAMVMRTRAEKGAITTEEQEKSDSLNVPEVVGISFAQAVKQRAFYCISVGLMLWSWAYMATLVHQVAFAVDMGIERVAAAGAVGLLTAFSIAGRLGFGRLGDIIDKRYVFMMGTTLQIIALVVLLKATNVTMLYIYSFLIGVNIGGVIPILPGLISDYFGKKYFGSIYGASYFIFLLGMAIGPVYGGWIFDSTGSYSISILTSLMLSLVAIVTVWFAGKPHQIFAEASHVSNRQKMVNK